MGKKLHEALGDWRSSATNVKSRIYAETIEGKKFKKRYPTYMKIAVSAAVLAAGITGVTLLTNEPVPTPVPAIEKNTDPKVEQATSFRPINETFLKIAQYEAFYNNITLSTQEGAVYYALSVGIEYYTLINHLADNGLYWDEATRDSYRGSMKTALDLDLEDPYFAAYFEKMLSELSITKEQYIEDYLLVMEEYEMLHSEMVHKKIGLIDGSYETSLEQEEFIQKMGLTFDYVQYLAASTDERLTPLEPQPKLSFNQDPEDSHLQLTKNLDGEYIFVDPEISLYDMPTKLEDYVRALRNDIKIFDFNRISYPQIKALVEQEAAGGKTIAQQTLDYFEILERSVDWEFTVQPYVFNDIPTFEKQGLRTHSDLTLKIAEYEIYHKSASMHEEYIAYRYANELVAEMYGLFNYLSQDYGYGWSAETRANYTASLTQELEASLQNELDKTYIENLLQEFNITLDDYIKYFLLPNKEYELLLQSMVIDKVGVDENGRFNPGKQSSRYRETIGLSWQKLFNVMEQKSNNISIIETDVTADLPFTLNPMFPITVGLNKDGEYVMVHPNLFELLLTNEQKALYLEIQAKNNLPPIARYSVQAYIMHTQLLSTETARELVEIFILLDRTVN